MYGLPLPGHFVYDSRDSEVDPLHWFYRISLVFGILHLPSAYFTLEYNSDYESKSCLGFGENKFMALPKS